MNLLNWQTDIDLGMSPHDGYGMVRQLPPVDIDTLLAADISKSALHPVKWYLCDAC